MEAAGDNEAAVAAARGVLLLTSARGTVDWQGVKFIAVVVCWFHSPANRRVNPKPRAL